MERESRPRPSNLQNLSRRSRRSPLLLLSYISTLPQVRLTTNQGSMHNFKLATLSIAFLLAGVASVTAQNQSVAMAPMHFRGLMPVVEVRLNGQGPFAFAIDTGAGLQADIDPSVATRLNLEPIGKIRIGDPTQQNDQTLEATKIARMELGGAEFRDVTAIIRSQRITDDYPAIDGILGFALFTDCLLTLDYPAMQVRIARGSLPRANGADILNFEIENKIPVIELAVGRLRLKAHIDSGNFVAGFYPAGGAGRTAPAAVAPVTVGRARSVSNLMEMKQTQLQDTIHIGTFEYPQATIAFPAPSDTNVGFKILREFALTFDQKTDELNLSERLPMPPGETTNVVAI